MVRENAYVFLRNQGDNEKRQRILTEGLRFKGGKCGYFVAGPANEERDLLLPNA